MFDVLPGPLRVLALAVVLIGGVASARGSCRPGRPAAEIRHPVVPGFERFHTGDDPAKVANPVEGGLILLGELNCTVVPCRRRGARAQVLPQAGTDPGQGRQPGAAGLPPRVPERPPGRQAGDDHAPPPRRLARRGEGGDRRGAGPLPRDDGEPCRGSRDAADDPEREEALSSDRLRRLPRPARSARAPAGRLDAAGRAGEQVHDREPRRVPPGPAQGPPLGPDARAQPRQERGGRAGQLPARRPQDPAAPEPRLPATTRETGRRFPTSTTLTPRASGRSAGFDISVAKRPDNMALRFEGFLQIAAAGEYTFHLTSDDGSKLFIDDALVVDNDGIHAPATKSGKIELIKGPHRLVVGVFNAGSDVGARRRVRRTRPRAAVGPLGHFARAGGRSRRGDRPGRQRPVPDRCRTGREGTRTLREGRLRVVPHAPCRRQADRLDADRSATGPVVGRAWRLRRAVACGERPAVSPGRPPARRPDRGDQGGGRGAPAGADAPRRSSRAR